MALLGPPPHSAEELARFLIGSIRQVCADEDLCRAWTDSVKVSLSTLGQQLGYEVLPRRASSGVRLPEFLFDLVWHSDDDGIVLAVECEWNPAGVIEDFRKLLYVKAPLKLMIYWVESQSSSGETVRQSLKDALHKYKRHLREETYLFIAFSRNADDRCFVFTPPNDGAVEHVDLTLVTIASSAKA